jgi:hypothetical protein
LSLRDGVLPNFGCRFATGRQLSKAAPRSELHSQPFAISLGFVLRIICNQVVPRC